MSENGAILEYTDRGKLKYWEENLSNCNFFYRRSPMLWPGIEPRLL